MAVFIDGHCLCNSQLYRRLGVSHLVSSGDIMQNSRIAKHTILKDAVGPHYARILDLVIHRVKSYEFP